LRNDFVRFGRAELDPKDDYYYFTKNIMEDRYLSRISYSHFTITRYNALNNKEGKIEGDSH